MLNINYNNGDAEKAGFDAKTGLPTEKLIAMQNYAAELKRKFPHMKIQRIANKVAQHFKVQVINKQPAGFNK